MKLRLRTPAYRWLAVALAVIVSAMMIEASARLWIAAADFDSNTLEGRERALHLEPGDADQWYRSGLNEQLDLENADPQKAIEDFHRAVRIDPRSADYWMALGDAYEQTGDIAQARNAFETAVSDYPDSGEVHWRYGSFLLRQDDLPKAYAEIHRALVSSPALATLAVSRVWRVTPDAQLLLTQVLPHSDRVLTDAMRWLVNEQDPQAALAVWTQIVTLGHPFPLSASSALVDLLITRQMGDEAKKVWHEGLTLSGDAGAENSGPSLVFNGGFERDATNDGLDWHLTPTPGVLYGYDNAHAHSGARSLSITFDGSQNLTYHGVWQAVPVEPNTQYHFSIALRTSGITTDKGLQVIVAFQTQPAIPLTPLTGDNEWLTQEANFTTAGNTHFALITLNRDPSEKFDNRLAGTIWLDDVSLVPITAAPAKP